MRFYEIYEGEKLIFTGTDSEVKKRFGCTSGMNWYSSQNHKIKGKYEVRAVDTDEPKKDQVWECLCMMLVLKREYFTQVYKDPHKYVPRLRELGVEVKITPSLSYTPAGGGLTAPRTKRKAEKCWRVERI